MRKTKVERENQFKYAFAGAGSGVITRALCQPLDVVKIRFQLQVEPITSRSKSSKYHGTMQAMYVIAKEEGLHGLWRGHVPAQFLSALYGFVQFQTYEVLKIEAGLISPGAEHNKMVHFMSGAVAGCAATAVSFPFDVIRTRLVAQGNNRAYRGIVHGLLEINRNEGLRACWRGLSPSLLVAGPLAGFQFLFYTAFKSILLPFRLFKDKSKEGKMNTAAELICGSMAGVSSKCITYPLDLARKRMQIQNFQHARVGYGRSFWCHGMINCIILTVKEEKLVGLFKGLYPSLIKAAFTTALHFMLYEEILSLL